LLATVLTVIFVCAVGQAGADVGLPAEACTLDNALKSLGYATAKQRPTEPRTL